MSYYAYSSLSRLNREENDCLNNNKAVSKDTCRRKLSSNVIESTTINNNKKSLPTSMSYKDYMFRMKGDDDESIEQPSIPFRSYNIGKEVSVKMNHGDQHSCASFDEKSNSTKSSVKSQSDKTNISSKSFETTSTTPSMPAFVRAPACQPSIYATMERLQPQRSIVKSVPDQGITLPGAYRHPRIGNHHSSNQQEEKEEVRDVDDDDDDEEASFSTTAISHANNLSSSRRSEDARTTFDSSQPTSATNMGGTVLLQDYNTTFSTDTLDDSQYTFRSKGGGNFVQEKLLCHDGVKEERSIWILRTAYIAFVFILFLSIGIGISFPRTFNSDASSVCSMTDIESACSMKTSSTIEIPACLDDLLINLQRNFPSQSFSLQNRPDDDVYEDLVCHPENLAILSVALHSRNIVSRQATLQRYGLSILYFTTQGHQWTRKDNWVSEKSHCDWLGISCSETEVDVVTGITLDNNNLRGSIPSSFLTLLPTLKYLDMSSNVLSGTIPPQVSELLELRLSRNSLVGSLPVSLLRSKAMQVLSLEYNLRLEIPEIPRFFTGPNWKEIVLGDIFFNASFPFTYVTLLNLEVLKLENMELIGTLPSGIALLTKLTTLQIHSNRMTGTIPTQIGRMTNLRELDMGENQLIGTLPSEIGYLTNLITFVVENNNINGTLPIQLSTLTNLTELDFMGNKLSGTISFEFGRLTNLQTFYFALNDFNGELPLEICNLRDTDNMSNFGMPLKSDCRAFGALTCPVSHLSCCCPS